jgi:hypothetical protein
VAVGLLAATGGFAIGGLAAGRGAVGLLASGGGAAGWFAQGGGGGGALGVRTRDGRSPRIIPGHDPGPSACACISFCSSSGLRPGNANAERIAVPLVNTFGSAAASM